MNSVGKPDAANPHVRFDERERKRGNWQSLKEPRVFWTLPRITARLCAAARSQSAMLGDYARRGPHGVAHATAEIYKATRRRHGMAADGRRAADDAGDRISSDRVA